MTSQWKPCTRDDICLAQSSNSMEWRPVTTDEEYLINWVSQLDLLCKPKSAVGFLGSCLFIGIMSTIWWVPSLSDAYGRRYPMLAAILGQLISYVAIYNTNSLNVAYACMILMGATFPGKHVVVYNYIMEICPSSHGQMVVNFTVFLETLILAVLAFNYQYISKDTSKPQLIGIIVTIISLAYTCLFFYESPSFLLTQGRFEEAREVLKDMAYFNGVPEEEIKRRFDRTKFQEEVIAEEVLQRANTEVAEPQGEVKFLDLADANLNKSAPPVIVQNVP